MKITLCLPEYNEGEIAINFIKNIRNEFPDLCILVIDDCSTTDKQNQLKSEFSGSNNVDILINNVNRGHGYSTLLGLRKSLELNSDIIINVDGDGQFRPCDIKNCLNKLLENPLIEIVEGCRINRRDKWFRRITTKITRFLIYLETGTIPLDANTPLRLYRRDSLVKLLEEIPFDSLIPNLHISKLTRSLCLSYLEIEVISLPRGGSSLSGEARGITWNQRFKYFPSKKFISFCLSAILEWIRATKLSRTLF